MKTAFFRTLTAVASFAALVLLATASLSWFGGRRDALPLEDLDVLVLALSFGLFVTAFSRPAGRNPRPGPVAPREGVPALMMTTLVVALASLIVATDRLVPLSKILALFSLAASQHASARLLTRALLAATEPKKRAEALALTFRNRVETSDFVTEGLRHFVLARRLGLVPGLLTLSLRRWKGPVDAIASHRGPSALLSQINEKNRDFEPWCWDEDARLWSLWLLGKDEEEIAAARLRYRILLERLGGEFGEAPDFFSLDATIVPAEFLRNDAGGLRASVEKWVAYRRASVGCPS